MGVVDVTRGRGFAAVVGLPFGRPARPAEADEAGLTLVDGLARPPVGFFGMAVLLRLIPLGGLALSPVAGMGSSGGVARLTSGAGVGGAPSSTAFPSEGSGADAVSSAESSSSAVISSSLAGGVVTTVTTGSSGSASTAMVVHTEASAATAKGSPEEDI